MSESEQVTALRRELGRRLAAARKDAGYAQREFAHRISYARSTLSTVESGAQRAGRTFWQACDQVLATGGQFEQGYDQIRARQDTERQQAHALARGEPGGLRADAPGDALRAYQALGWPAAADGHVIELATGTVLDALAVPQTAGTLAASWWHATSGIADPIRALPALPDPRHALAVITCAGQSFFLTAAGTYPWAGQPAPANALGEARPMVVRTNIPDGVVPQRPAGMLLVAAMDLEWSRNHHVPGGNVPFCYSVTSLVLPGAGTRLDTVPFWYTSVYVCDADQTQDLITSANETLATLLTRADLVAGHQFGSDLAALARASRHAAVGLEAARAAWRQRRLALPGQARIIDTCYDADHILTCNSRRLADICRNLGLLAAQPELRHASRATLRHRSMQSEGADARDKVTVLNLRHSLCTALIAARATGVGSWHGTLDINELLTTRLAGSFGWLSDPAFIALSRESDAA